MSEWSVYRWAMNPAPFVRWQQELRDLRALVASGRAASRPVVAVVRGEMGIGKAHLVGSSAPSSPAAPGVCGSPGTKWNASSPSPPRPRVERTESSATDPGCTARTASSSSESADRSRRHGDGRATVMHGRKLRVAVARVVSELGHPELSWPSSNGLRCW